MPSPESPLSRRRCAPLAGALALALFALSLGDAFAGGMSSKQRSPTPRCGGQSSSNDFSNLREAPHESRARPVKYVNGPQNICRGAIEDVQTEQQRAHAKSLRRAERSERSRAGPRRLEALEQATHTRAVVKKTVKTANKVDAEGLLEPRPVPHAVQIDTQRRDPQRKIKRVRFASEERGKLSDLHADSRPQREVRSHSLAPLQGAGARLAAADRERVEPSVAQWQGTPMKTASSLEAVRMALSYIKHFNGDDDARSSQAQAIRAGYIFAQEGGSFDDIWRNSLRLDYRPLQVSDGDVRAAIEQTIDDASLDTAEPGSALIALPQPMRFADLPQPERIAMVIARSAPEGASTPRYAAIGRAKPHHVHLRMAYPSWGADGQMSVQMEKLSKVSEATLTMDQVEYVIYRPSIVLTPRWGGAEVR
ncbi:hypothetical protein GALL_332860 [mine drainage metagenome]|uniref:Uncharacterized protein n=1 Tax=mine drainage metagenome TaxID=410659 RepID=A0A1J5QYG1_9ZZZZ